MIHAERLRPGAEIAAELVEGQRQVDRLLLHNARLAAELDASGYWEDEGSNSAIDWVRFNCHLTDKAAGDLIVVGEREESLAESAQAMEQGEIGFAHMVVLARTAEAVGEAVRRGEAARACSKAFGGQVLTTSVCTTGIRSMPPATPETRLTSTRSDAYR
jgi:hypothetical protein